MVDRKDLDTQTLDEFNRFQKDCVEENITTAALVERMLSDSYADKVIVTTIQKLGIALDAAHRANYAEQLKKPSGKRVVFIFDECHRSQFGDTHENIKTFFPKAHMFGFTGTPIFEENSTAERRIGDQAYKLTTSALRLLPGDILLNRTKSIDLVGQVSIFDLDGDYATASYIVVFRLNQQIISPRFCNYFLNTPVSQRLIRAMATRAVSQANINPSSFRRDFKIALPSLEEQLQIANALHENDHRISFLTEEVNSFRSHKAALMQQLFPTLDEAEVKANDRPR